MIYFYFLFKAMQWAGRLRKPTSRLHRLCCVRACRVRCAALSPRCLWPCVTDALLMLLLCCSGSLRWISLERNKLLDAEIVRLKK